jgi:hypothetical protein
VGLVIGLIAAPAAAVAATFSVVKIVGSNGTKAIVARTGQLSTTVADPNSFRAFHKYGIGASCAPIFTAPSGSSMIVTQITVDVYVVGSQIGVSTSSSCNGLLLDWNTATIGAMVFPLGPGIVIPAGKSLYAFTVGGTGVEMYGYGYTVPVAAAPKLTPTTPVLSSADPQSQGRS